VPCSYLGLQGVVVWGLGLSLVRGSGGSGKFWCIGKNCDVRYRNSEYFFGIMAMHVGIEHISKILYLPMTT